MEHSAAHSTAATSFTPCLDDSNGDGNGDGDGGGCHWGVLTRQNGETPPEWEHSPRTRLKRHDSRDGAGAQSKVLPEGWRNPTKRPSCYSTAESSLESELHCGATAATSRLLSSMTQQSRLISTQHNSQPASDVASVPSSHEEETRGRIAEKAAAKGPSGAPPSTTTPPPCMSITGRPEEANDSLYVNTSYDGTQKNVVGDATSGSHSPYGVLLTPSMRSPTPLDLTAPPKQHVLRSQSCPTDRSSAEAAFTRHGEGFRGASGSHSVGRDDAQQQHERPASPSPSCVPLQFACGNTDSSDNHQERSVEAVLQNSYLLGFSSSAAEAHSCTHSHKGRIQREWRLNGEVESERKPAVTPLQAAISTATHWSSKAPPPLVFPEADEEGGGCRASPIASAPARIASGSAENSALALRTSTATPCPSSRPTPECTPRSVLPTSQGGTGCLRSPRANVAAAPTLMDRDGYVLPAAPQRKAAMEREGRERGHWSTPRGSPAPQPTSRTLSLAPVPSTATFSIEGDAHQGQAEDDAEGGSVSPHTRALRSPSGHHHRTHRSMAQPIFSPASQMSSLCPMKSFMAERLCVPQIVPTHESVFFPFGTDVIAPVMLHYATVGGWSTFAGGRDYFNHRRLRGGEVAGHTVLWLHTAQPRDRFVFLVTPVANCEELERLAWQPSQQQQPSPSPSKGVLTSTPSNSSATRRKWGLQRPQLRGAWRSLLQMLFGEAPWFTVSRTACGSRSRIACDDAIHSSLDDTVMSSMTISPSGVREPAPYSFPATRCSSRDHHYYTNGGAEGGEHTVTAGSSSPLPLHHGTASTAEAMHSSCSNGGSEMRCSSSALPCYCISPMLVARQPSQGSTSARLTPVHAPGQVNRSSSCPAPPALRAAPPSAAASAHTPAANTGDTAFFPIHAAASYNSGGGGGGGEDADTYNSGYHSEPRRDATLSDFRHRASSSRFVFSPFTGTAVSTSGVTPVTPHPRSHWTSRRRQQQQQRQEAQINVPSSESIQTDKAVAASTAGVEVIEIIHADVTAMDYAPRLTSHRLSIEAAEVHTYFFPTLMDALEHYQCAAAMALMEEQWAAGITSQIPRPQGNAPLSREQRQQQKASCAYRGGVSSSSVHTTSPHGHPAWTDAHSDQDLASLPRSPPENASPVGSASEGAQPQRRASTQSASVALQPLSLASALRSAGRGGDGNGERPIAAPTLLFRQDSLPSLSVDAEALSGDSSKAHLRSALPSFAALNPTAAKKPQDSLSPRRGNTSALQNGAGPGSPLDTSSASQPATPPRVSPPATHGARPYVPPKLTSTHREIVVSVYTADPIFNSVLRELLTPEPGTHPYTTSVAEQKRMLSMVEVGMPAWAIFYSSTGLPYRRLFRLLYSGLTNLWPLLSLAVGVYDLYKHLPQLKTFMERTLGPLTRWIERRFTLRFSVLATYLISVVVTICSSLGAFVSQFYVVQLLSLPIVQLIFALIKLPFVLAFDTIWLFTSTALGTVRLVLQLIRVVVMAPVVFAMNIASLRETVGVVAPVAVQGTSLSVKWWKAWSEFWETVASPMKNAVRAWWDSMIHVSASAARRETSIRRWYTPKLEQYSTVLCEVQDMISINAQLWWTDFIHPGLRRFVLLAVALVYLYWLFLGISDKVWDDFIYASGVRHPTADSSVEAAQQPLVKTKRYGYDRSSTAKDDDVAPVALLYFLFRSPFSLLSAVGTGITTSSSSAATTTTTMVTASFNDSCTNASAAVPLMPASVIQMCDSTGTSTITTTTTRTTSALSGTSSTATLVTTIITVIPMPPASLLPLAAELLLPNAVLELLYRVSHLLSTTWGAVTYLAAAWRSSLFS
ncbi:hypothetical protein ABL78_2501 [Leptomonas seymouri]|uniref:Transmembrane protein n=1 Tax=Leptomonas seymouri TaxID=5684 RepID=A0A0N1ILJ5_LEPSE|nr:hypothetical protein ABL78_2501 [Leptomonas seymouri]|eukprot:KPI88382.1 hypothetical protein ABL78_2501 [Leptomonas seymouri]